MFDYGKNVRIYAGEDLTQRYYIESTELIILTDTYKITLETLDDNTYFRILDPHSGVKKYSMNIDEDGKKKIGDLKYDSNYIPEDRCLNNIFLKGVNDEDNLTDIAFCDIEDGAYMDLTCNDFSLKPIPLLFCREVVYRGNLVSLRFKLKPSNKLWGDVNYRCSVNIALVVENDRKKDWDYPPQIEAYKCRIKVSIEDVIR